MRVQKTWSLIPVIRISSIQLSGKYIERLIKCGLIQESLQCINLLMVVNPGQNFLKIRECQKAVLEKLVLPFRLPIPIVFGQLWKQMRVDYFGLMMEVTHGK